MALENMEYSNSSSFKLLDLIANLGVKVKLRIALLVVGVLPPIGLSVLMNHVDFSALKSWVALYVVASIVLWIPSVELLGELIVLRLTRRINAYVEAVKGGSSTPPYADLPPEKGDEHDFLRLQRNILWMVRGLQIREQRLQSALKRMESMARCDGLTGVWNRRYFMELGQRELARTCREKTSVSLIYFDVDHFKTVNDKYGHPIGDKVLMDVAHLVRSQLRTLDVFGRLGGEEFAVLLPGTGREGGLSVAEKLRATIENHEFVLREGSFHCTASFGVTTKEDDDRSLEELVNAADRAMYSAKKQGRNKIMTSAI